ncbi:hypothetical protein NUW58_g7972 [Xylaria curta]|uniref:Uncharacterized protein n=1 Tax=Xylaria curta TaxID=42375 RepID=A0ACC1NC95_9PEZI|nr:hypothetical protein NUW58_g7972 [Xylaria curta]
MTLMAAIVYARRRFRRLRISNRPRGSYRGGDTLLAIYDKSPRRLQVEYALGAHQDSCVDRQAHLAEIGREDAFDVFQTCNSSALSPTDIIEAQKSLYPQPTGLKETRDDRHGTRHFLMRLAIMLVKVLNGVDDEIWVSPNPEIAMEVKDPLDVEAGIL